MSNQIKILETTADIGIQVSSDNLPGLFETAAEGLFDLICNRIRIVNRQALPIQVEAEDISLLLAAWLNELIWLHDCYSILFNRFQIVLLTDQTLSALAWGEKLDRSRHELYHEVKAATYHRLKVEKTSEGCIGQVIFDI